MLKYKHSPNKEQSNEHRNNLIAMPDLKISCSPILQKTLIFKITQGWAGI